MMQDENVVENLNQLLKTLRDQWVCPISQQPVKDPVLTLDGHTYQRNKIQQWYLNNNYEPITKKVLQKTLVQNRALKNTISILQAKLPALAFSYRLKEKQVKTLNERVVQISKQLQNQVQKNKSSDSLLQTTWVQTIKEKKIKKQQQDKNKIKVHRLQQEIKQFKKDRLRIFQLEQQNQKLKSENQQLKELATQNAQLKETNKKLSESSYDQFALYSQQIRCFQSSIVFMINQNGHQSRFNALLIKKLWSGLRSAFSGKDLQQIKSKIFEEIDLQLKNEKWKFQKLWQQEPNSQQNKLQWKNKLSIIDTFLEKAKVYKQMDLNNLVNSKQLIYLNNNSYPSFQYTIGYQIKNLDFLKKFQKLASHQNQLMRNSQNYPWNNVIKINIDQQTEINGFDWKQLIQNAKKFPNLIELYIENLKQVQIKGDQFSLFPKLIHIWLKKQQLSESSLSSINQYQRSNPTRIIRWI